MTVMNDLYNEILNRWVEYCDMLDEIIKVSATVRKQHYAILLGLVRAYEIVYGTSITFDPVERTVQVKGA